jgi:hypothetical protein
MSKRLQQLRHSWVTFWKQEVSESFAQPWSPLAVPISSSCFRFAESIKYFFGNLLNQPLDGIAEYYGEGVAYYFAYIGYYTEWLKVPAAFGVLVFFFQVMNVYQITRVCNDAQ